MKLEKKVCHCKNVTNGDIKAAVENGAKTIEDLKQQTRLGQGCKRCLEAAQRVMDDCIE